MIKARTIICMLVMLMLTTVSAFGQTTVVTGEVKDNGGNPLIGAQVHWKDAKSGVITDVNGNFTIGIPKNGNSILVVSYLGYKTLEVAVKDGQSQVDIILKDDAQSLDELVVIGYGLQKKSSLTGSVETINLYGNGCLRDPP